MHMQERLVITAVGAGMSWALWESVRHVNPGPHRTCQRCSGPVCDRPSASRPGPARFVPSKTSPFAPGAPGGSFDGTKRAGTARTVANRAGTALTDAVRTGLNSNTPAARVMGGNVPASGGVSRPNGPAVRHEVVPQRRPLYPGERPLQLG